MSVPSPTGRSQSTVHTNSMPDNGQVQVQQLHVHMIMWFRHNDQTWNVDTANSPNPADDDEFDNDSDSDNVPDLESVGDEPEYELVD